MTKVLLHILHTKVMLKYDVNTLGKGQTFELRN